MSKSDNQRKLDFTFQSKGGKPDSVSPKDEKITFNQFLWRRFVRLWRPLSLCLLFIFCWLKGCAVEAILILLIASTIGSEIEIKFK